MTGAIPSLVRGALAATLCLTTLTAAGGPAPIARPDTPRTNVQPPPLRGPDQPAADGTTGREPVSRITPSQAARIARDRNGGGRILGVKLTGSGEYYRVKLLRDGEMRVLRVNAIKATEE